MKKCKVMLLSRAKFSLGIEGLSWTLWLSIPSTVSTANSKTAWKVDLDLWIFSAKTNLQTNQLIVAMN